MKSLKKCAAPASGQIQQIPCFTLAAAVVLFYSFSMSSLLCAQARPTGTRSARLQAGIGFATANSDYRSGRFNGIAAYVDLDFTPHIGIEGAFHFVTDGSGSGIYEKTYEIGGRYHRTWGRLMPYARAMYGRGVFNFANYPGYGHPNLAYNMLVAGGGLDYRVLPHVNARADAEYQHWLGFPPHGLSPALLTLGAAFRF